MNWRHIVFMINILDMKNYNKILEAVNRGIQLALDDMEDIEDINPISQTSDVIDSEDVLQHYACFYRIIEKLGVPPKSTDDTLTVDEIDNLIVYSKEHNVKYVPKDKDDLDRILKPFLWQYSHADLNWIDTRKITDMRKLFMNSVFNGDISEWDTSNVTHADRMFENNQIFNGDISKWNVSKLVSAYRMFFNASSFNCDLSNWDPCNLEDGIEMFYGTINLKCNLGNWKLYKCKRFGDMFTRSGLTLRGFNSPKFFPN